MDVKIQFEQKFPYHKSFVEWNMQTADALGTDDDEWRWKIKFIKKSGREKDSFQDGVKLRASVQELEQSALRSWNSNRHQQKYKLDHFRMKTRDFFIDIEVELYNDFLKACYLIE